MKVKYKYLPACQVGVPDGEGDVEDCGDPSLAYISFEDGSSLYVCAEHFFDMADSELYDFESEDE